MQVACPRCTAVLEYVSERPAFCSRCGSPLRDAAQATPGRELEATTTGAAPATEAAVPERVGSYRLLRPLGAGGMGSVYEAEDAATGRRVAVKLISPDYAESADAVERFRREGRLASTLAHPRCVFVFAADEEAGRPYIVMELMPGRTLEDVVAERGPLPPGEAVAHILDVIDGLEEAHRLGFIHRDVKPSNCFLDRQGRVKVGDFGLAKALVPGAHLTRTGAFLGTLLFAAPEQIKGEPVDPQTDVYAVAATLYYLLSGRAPYQGGDAAATLARIVSEAAPPMRTLRPELPPGLDDVVLRGLERDRPRRWRDLAELREALLPFQPGQSSVSYLGLRFAAYLIDWVCLALFGGFVFFPLLVAVEGKQVFNPQLGVFQVRQTLAAVVCLLYFALSEGLAGASVGKRFLNLRMARASAGPPPGILRVFLRSAVFVGFLNLGVLVAGALWYLYLPPGTTLVDLSQPMMGTHLLLSFVPLAGLVLGVALLFAPMRPGNGYRGLHEWLSGTRVIRLPWREPRRVLRGRPSDLPVVRPDGLPERLSPFVIGGALRWDERAKIVVGEDRGLGRTVWLWLRPRTEPPVPAARREIGRATRPRWLACGQHGEWQWDAFMALSGTPLPALIGDEGKCSWPEVRPVLEQLGEELAAASAEGTLPDPLRPDHVWIRPDGRVQLLDLPLFGDEDPPPTATGPGRALALLGDVAALALEGRPRPGQAGPVRAPLPLHAARVLDRLLAAKRPYDRVDAFQGDLKRTADRPVEVSRARRAAHLGVLTAFLFLGVSCCMLPVGWFREYMPHVFLYLQLQDEEHRVRDLEEGARLEFCASAVSPNPLLRLQALVQLDADERLTDRLRQRLQHDRELRAARLESMNKLGREYALGMEPNMTAQWAAAEENREHMLPRTFGKLHFRSAASFLMDWPRPNGEGRELIAILFAALLAWPVLWVLWAFLWRGGLSYRIVGLALVRASGRPALRVQCLWRALLVWAPVAGLLTLSLWLQDRGWLAVTVGAGSPWELTLASVTWYATLVLLAAYLGLALWRPARGPHDYLAGTYLVPR
jgi:hypothetical protein